jgi:hypothetical protein
MEETSLQGPVLMVNGRLTLMIPLEDGAAEYVACSRGNSEVEGSCLKIAIPEWLAGMLRIDEGDIVRVSNWDGKLRIDPNEATSVQWVCDAKEVQQLLAGGCFEELVDDTIGSPYTGDGLSAGKDDHERFERLLCEEKDCDLNFRESQEQQLAGAAEKFAALFFARGVARVSWCLVDWVVDRGRRGWRGWRSIITGW